MVRQKQSLGLPMLYDLLPYVIDATMGVIGREHRRQRVK